MLEAVRRIPVLDLAHWPMLRQTYLRLIAWHQSDPAGASRGARLAFEGFLQGLVVILSLTRGVRFPSRAVGGWWWTWRIRWELLAGWLEYDTVQWCRRLVEPGSIALDIGAHVGYYSWLLSRLVTPDGKVIAYEPSPENFPLLAANCLSVRAFNVVPVNAAVSDVNGSVDLYVSPGNSNHSLNPDYTQYEKVIKVPSLSVDDHLASLGLAKIGFAKIDTEGSEVRVLRGMRKVLRNSPSLQMIVELNPRALAAGGFVAADLLGPIREAGFEPKVISSGGSLLPIDEIYEGPSVNLLCLREASS